jgi:RNA 3'-terminal phosphate cyclase (ATP)
MNQMIKIDGSKGEGGGQILRTSLSLSLITGTAFQITGIRAGRRKPGLLRQHLTAVNAAAEIGEAETEGANLGSTELTFSPKAIRAGDYRFSIGSAGNAMLAIQTVLPALMMADKPSKLTVEGGTHHPAAPPFDFLKKTFLPQLHRIGPEVRLEIERPGFFPAGGGLVHAEIRPAPVLRPIKLLDRGAVLSQRARCLISKIPPDVAKKELRVVRNRLSLSEDQCTTEIISNSPGPGNVLLVEIECEHVTEVISAYGERGVKSEWVAKNAARAARDYLETEAPVGEHLADQLLLPMAVAGGGEFKTGLLSQHTLTNIETIRLFLPMEIEVEEFSQSQRIVRIDRQLSAANTVD